MINSSRSHGSAWLTLDALICDNQRINNHNCYKLSASSVFKVKTNKHSSCIKPDQNCLYILYLAAILIHLYLLYDNVPSANRYLLLDGGVSGVIKFSFRLYADKGINSLYNHCSNISLKRKTHTDDDLLFIV